MTTPVSNFSRGSAHSNQIIIDYILSHAVGDQRPYLEISVLGRSMLGLLDSGSSLTIVGTAGFEFLQELGLPLDNTRRPQCVVANGQPCCCMGTITAPVCLRGEVRVIDFVVVPEVSAFLILGMDFWKTMGVVPDLRHDEWHFQSEAECHVSEIKADATLSGQDRARLAALLEKKFQEMGAGLGYATAVEHKIVVDPNVQPIKQPTTRSLHSTSDF